MTVGRTRLLRRASLRHLRRHPWQAALSVVGITLGVAVVLAVDLAIGSARQGFALSTEAVAGAATHQVAAGPSGIPDSAYLAVRELAAVEAAAPVVDDNVTSRGRALRLLGIDPFAEGPFRRFGAAVSGSGAAPGELIGRRAGLLSAGTAAALGVDAGDWLRLDVGGRRDSLRVAGVLEPGDRRSRLALENLVLVDVGTAQDLLDRTGLDRVDLVVSSGGGVAADAALERVAGLLPGDAVIRPAGAATGTFREMTRAFDLNLRALSLLGIIFGAFLIYNSITFSVVQRRRLLGTLRALGASRRQVFGVVQLEALALGLAGTLLGLAVGYGLAGGLVRLVTRTIQDLYFVLTVRELVLSPAALARAALLGVGGTMLAALPPAWEAASTHPRTALLRSSLESGLRRRLPLVTLVGLGLMVAGTVTLALAADVDGSFAGLFGVIIGAALLTPALTVLLVRALRPAAGAAFGVLGRMAASGVSAGLSRTAPAIAALTIAVAVVVGIGTMVDSFRSSLVVWLERTLAADLYIAPAGSGGAGAALDPRALQALRAHEAVAEARPNRRTEVAWSMGGATSPATVELLAVGVDSRLRSQFDILAGELDDAAWSAFAAGRAVLVSEPLAYRHDLSPGDTLVLGAAAGPRGWPVAAVFRDYGSDRGMVMMSRAGYMAGWDDPSLTALALNLRPGADLAAVAEALRQATAGIQALEVRPNARLRQATLEVFDRTFVITDVLRLLALVVAFVGVLSALMALQLERSRELGVLRATGMTPAQVWGMVGSQTGLIGLVAGIMALPLGVLLAVLMIEFVNRRSFGWSMDLVVSSGLLVQGLGIALAAALLAGLYPSWRMARTSPAEALRSE